ncbi:unnamed protein product [Cunninghamella echinulata]
MKPSHFILVSKSGKKIALENTAHPCPQCKNHASVQLTRSERQFILLNKRIKDSTSVKYECHHCHWKDSQLPNNDISTTSLMDLHRYLSTSYTTLSLPSSSANDLDYYYNDTVHSSSSFQL